MASKTSSRLDQVDIESQSQQAVMVSAAGDNSSSTSFRGKWRRFRVVYRASQILISAKADQAAQKSFEEIAVSSYMQATVITSTQVSIDLHIGDPNDYVNENGKLQHETIAKIVKSRDLNGLQRFGGVQGLAEALDTHLQEGIRGDEEDLRSRRINDTFSDGQAPAQGGFFKLLLRSCNSCIIFLLFASAVLSIGFGIDEEGLRTGWAEGALIALGTTMLVVLSSIRESRNKWIRKMLEKQKSTEKREVVIDVVRGGNRQKISISDVVYGDIVFLSRGCKVPGDGLFFSDGFLKLDNGSATIDGRNPFLHYGEKVINGDGHMLVTSVGINTKWGEMMSQVTKVPAKIILPAQLDKLSFTTQIIGLSISILILVVVFLRFKLGKELHQDSGAPEIKQQPVSIEVLADLINRISSKPRGSLNVLMTSLMVLVLGFTEGVPFIVTLAVFYWNKKVLCDKAGYVKESMACVGMGSVTAICTGQTGGLTLGSEKVVVVSIGGEAISEETVIGASVLEALCNGISAPVLKHQNPGCSIGDPVLSWATLNLGLELENLKESCTIIGCEEFGFCKEGSRVLMRKNRDEEGHMCLHMSGPAKTILTMSSFYYDSKGTVKILDDHKRLAFEENIEHMRSRNLKTVAFAYKMVDSPTFEDDDSFILIGLIGLKHICPEKTRKTMKAFIDADVKIILISEDDVSVLKAIGLHFGILNGSERLEFDGADFRSLTDEQRRDIIDDISVIGNCLPGDKLLLVQCLKQKGHMVAMVGARTNDIPALTEANLGIAMGTQSSEFAKENSDIIISGEDFNTLVTIISHGRCAYNNIQKYIQFEVTMFVAWLLVSTITTSALGDAPLTTIQWFWANLIVFIPGGLALLTEPPSKKLMDKPPMRQTGPFITKSMLRNIVTEALFQATSLVTFQFTSQTILQINKEVCKTMIFNSFVLFQVFNLFNTRKLNMKNIFKGMYQNLWLRVAVDVILLLQLAFIEIAHNLVGNAKLNGEQWGICVLIGMLSLLFDLAAKNISTLVGYCLTGSHVDSATTTHSSESTSNLKLQQNMNSASMAIP